MDNKKFVELAKKAVVDYYNENGNKITADEVYVVWLCKTLQNNKALLSTNVSDGKYCEVTLNGEKIPTNENGYFTILEDLQPGLRRNVFRCL